MEPEQQQYRIDQQTMSQLIEEVGSWSQNNFEEKQAPVLGVIEEVGEACHGILKNIQRIRGFDDFDKFHNHLYDAFGDTMIYACNLAYNHGAFFCFRRNVQAEIVSKHPDYFILSHLLQAIAAILNQETREIADRNIEINIYNGLLQRLCNIMEIWAKQYNIDLGEATKQTWAKIVAKRDWKADTTEGGGHKHN